MHRNKLCSSGIRLTRRCIIPWMHHCIRHEEETPACTVRLWSRCRSVFKTREFRFDYFTNMVRRDQENRVVLEAPERIPERMFLGRGLAYVLRSP